MDETQAGAARPGPINSLPAKGLQPLPADDGLMTRPTHAYVDPAVYNLPAGEARVKPADPKRISHRHQTIAYMAASGNMDHKQIAAATGYTAVRVYQILRCNRMKQLVASIQAQTHGMTVAQKFQSILPGAIKVAEDMLHDPTTPRRIKADLAWKFIYQGAGKPTETVNVHQTSNIADLFKALDQIERESKPRDITIEATAPSAPSHSSSETPRTETIEVESESTIEDWVDAIVVGGAKREGKNE